MEFFTLSQERIVFALLFTIIISSIFVVTNTILVEGKKKKQKKKRPPEPSLALPFLGHLHLLAKTDQLLHRKFADMADKHGPAFLIRLGIHQALVVSSWEIAKECFTTNDRIFSTRPTSLALKVLAYNQTMFGFAPYGPYWREVKKLVVVELLSNRRLELLSHVRDKEINCFLKELYEQTVKSGGVAVVEMNERFGDLAMDIILKMVAGKTYSGVEGSSNDESRLCQKAMVDFFSLTGILLISDMIPCLGWVDVLMGRISKMKNTAKELDFFLESWVNEHRERRRLRGGLKGEQDFIDVMLSIMDDGNNTPTQEANTTIKSTCLSLILGGKDTTSITLSWALSLLLNNEHVLKRAQDELDVHIGKHRQVEESDIKNLVYLQAIIKETLRLYPAGPLSSPREAMEDCTIAGFDIPAGTRLFVNLWKLQRDPSIWERPLDFLSERFLTDHHANTDVRGKNFELMPFGSGRRMCPGVSFALRVSHLALARLLHAFELGRVSGKAIDMTEKPGLAVPRATPLEVILTPRLSPMLYG